MRNHTFASNFVVNNSLQEDEKDEVGFKNPITPFYEQHLSKYAPFSPYSISYAQSRSHLTSIISPIFLKTTMPNPVTISKHMLCLC